MERHIEVWQGEEWLCSDVGKIVKLRDLYKAYEVELANYARTVSDLRTQLADREQELAECRDNLRFYKEQTDFRGQQIMKMRGET